jgi:hypothetical protein
MTSPLARNAWRRGFVFGMALAAATWFAAIGGLLGLGAFIDRVWTGPLGERSIAVLAIGQFTDAPGAYTQVAEIDGHGAFAAFAALLTSDRWAVLSEPISRKGETVSILPGRIVDPKARECLVVMHRRPEHIDVSECLAPIAGRR